MSNQDVRLNIRTDTNEAVRQLRSLERQVDKLGNLADQGERNQKGFLSRRQVTLYRRILGEMEQSHAQHVNKLAQAEEQLNRMKNSQQAQRIKDLEAEIRKREELLRMAEGGNRWGEQSNPIVQEFHRQRLDSARSDLDNTMNSQDYREFIESTGSLETEVSKLRETVAQMNSEMDRGNLHSGRIDDLRTRSPMTNMVEDGAGMLSRLAPIGILGYGAYVGTGVSKLRQQEASAWQVSQKMGSFGDEEQHDELLRSESKDVGRANGYNALETTTTMGHLIAGGTNGDVQGRLADTDALQKFARGNAMDVNELAIASADLQKIGAVNEGNLQRFAELIAGSIAKGNMSGREEESLRAVVSLAEKVSSGLSGLSETRLDSLVGLQTSLSEAIPTLSGSKGAEMLGGMDSAFKSGSHALQLVMGKGRLPEFSGIKGVTNLNQMLEQGLTPENLQYLFQGMDTTFGKDNHTINKQFLKETDFMSMETYDKLVESGLAERFKKGTAVGADELRGIGAEDILKDWESYDGTSTSEVQSMEAYKDNRQADHSQPFDEADKGIRGMFNSMPEWMQHGAIAGGALGGSLLMPMAMKGLRRMVSPRVGGGGPGTGGSLLSRVKGLGSSAWSGIKGMGSAIAGAGSKAWSGIKGFAGRATSALGGSADDVAEGALRGGAKLGARVPIAGALIGAGADQLLNEENSWGRSLAKGVGGAIGGTLGFLGGGALGLGTGGVGLAAIGATTVGGGVAGEKAGDWLYSKFSGEGKKKKEESASTYDEAVTEFSKTAPKAGKEAEDMLSKANKEHVIKLIVEGGIAGMNKSNEDKVAEGMRDYLQKLAKQNNGNTSINLSLDQSRLT